MAHPSYARSDRCLPHLSRHQSEGTTSYFPSPCGHLSLHRGALGKHVGRTTSEPTRGSLDPADALLQVEVGPAVQMPLVTPDPYHEPILSNARRRLVGKINGHAACRDPCLSGERVP